MKRLLLLLLLLSPVLACTPAPPPPDPRLAQLADLLEQQLAQQREPEPAATEEPPPPAAPMLFEPDGPSLFRTQWVTNPENPATPAAMRFLDGLWMLQAADGTWNARVADFSNRDPSCLGAGYCVVWVEPDGRVAPSVFFAIDGDTLYPAECFVWDEVAAGRARPERNELEQLTGRVVTYLGFLPQTVCTRAVDSPSWTRAQVAF